MPQQNKKKSKKKTKKAASSSRVAVAADFLPKDGAMGRPKRCLDLPDGWERAVLDIYRGGGSDAEVRVWIRDQGRTISNDLWYRWLEEEPHFSETIKMGHDLAEAWWHTTGRGLTVGAMKGNAAVWIVNMKNRFGYRDKVELDATHRINPLQAIADECSARPVFDADSHAGGGEPARPALEVKQPLLDNE